VDPLTGLNNRRAFLILATQQLKTTDRMQDAAVLIFADLDGLKWINDNLGHSEGDRALVDTSNILRRSFRASDIIARLSGDEFVGLGIETQENMADVIVARLQEHLNAFNLQESRPYKLSISFGLARYSPQNPCSLLELLDEGDKAMYAQKQAKKLNFKGIPGEQARRDAG
jgi:diguanylate cyclase (GGDEF)-like protein